MISRDAENMLTFAFNLPEIFLKKFRHISMKIEAERLSCFVRHEYRVDGADIDMNVDSFPSFFSFFLIYRLHCNLGRTATDLRSLTCINVQWVTQQYFGEICNETLASKHRNTDSATGSTLFLSLSIPVFLFIAAIIFYPKFPDAERFNARRLVGLANNLC